MRMYSESVEYRFQEGALTGFTQHQAQYDPDEQQDSWDALPSMSARRCRQDDVVDEPPSESTDTTPNTAHNGNVGDCTWPYRGS